MTGKTIGRPRTYTSEQVREAIDIVGASGAAITAASVKKAMVAELDVSGGINAQTLEGEVERLLIEREDARRAKLIDALPQTSLDMADAIAATIREAALGYLATELERLRSDADRRVADRENDLAAQRDRNAALLSKIAGKDAEIAALEDRVGTLTADLTMSQSERTAHAQEVERLRQREDISGQLAAMVRELRESLTAGKGTEPGGRASGRASGVGAEAADLERSGKGKAATSSVDKSTSAGGIVSNEGA